MRMIRKVVLIAEAVMSFAPMVLIWLLGFFMSPVFLFGLLAGVDVELATVLLAITLGGIGLWGVVHLTIKVIQPNYRVITPRVLKRFLACGYLAVFIAIQLFDPELQELAVIFLPPLLVTTHFMYLARGYLWQRVTGAK